MATTILNFRSTFIWTETLPAIPGATLDPLPEFHFLTRSDLYQDRFQACLDRNDPLGLEPPWQTHANQLFWKYYLPGAVLASASPRQAWKCLVPLRRPMTLRIDPGNGGSASVEGYYYPHGIALAVTFRYSGARTLEEAAALAWTMRRRGVVREDGCGEAPLQSVVDRALGWLRESLFGAGARPGAQRGPFTLSTVLKARSDSPGPEPIQSDPQLHRALETLTSWPPNPETATLPDLARVSVPVDDWNAVLYARPRARALWFPGLFGAAGAAVCSLACYHRNLMFGSMQVDSLGGLVAAVAAELRGGTQPFQLAPALRACAQNACERLADIFGGDKRSTYRSRSLQWQIQQNDLADLNFLRRKFLPGAADLPPLP